jgi:hypothetical protein
MESDMSKIIVSGGVLPAEFSGLQKYADDGWTDPIRAQRTEKRLASTIEEIRGFYDAVVPHLPRILDYLDTFPLDAMPEEQARLLHLAFSVAEVRNAVESFGQPDVVDGWETRRFVIHAPFIAGQETSTRPRE